MRFKHITTTVFALAFSAFAFSASAENTNSNDANHNWMPKQPGNAYWQTPNWSGFNMPSAYKQASLAEVPVPQGERSYCLPGHNTKFWLSAMAGSVG